MAFERGVSWPRLARILRRPSCSPLRSALRQPRRVSPRRRPTPLLLIPPRRPSGRLSTRSCNGRQASLLSAARRPVPRSTRRPPPHWPLRRPSPGGLRIMHRRGMCIPWRLGQRPNSSGMHVATRRAGARAALDAARGRHAAAADFESAADVGSATAADARRSRADRRGVSERASGSAAQPRRL